MSAHCTCEEILERKQIEATRHRKDVLEIFVHAPKAVKAKDVLERIRKASSIDKVTVYRILDLFVERDILKRINTLDGAMAYELVCAKHRPIHPHFFCRHCGEISCLEGLNWEAFKLQVERKSRVQCEDVDVRLEGVCKECRQS
jgi:Fur family ferric uptake transcriptional regulator